MVLTFLAAIVIVLLFLLALLVAVLFGNKRQKQIIIDCIQRILDTIGNNHKTC
ncbi:hypothetical protein [Halobacillus seohaensis]|uniref:Uncharacterized protein n=1 Tax=Halobacillus seohaensis TaxID=447421 RepID=A0ABW2ENX4_9BACI